MALEERINEEIKIKSIIDQKISLETFYSLSGKMTGCPFVKVVLNTKTSELHFINDNLYKLHSLYIAENLLHLPAKEVLDNIDEYNKGFYLKPNRDYLLGIIAFHQRPEKSFFTIETTEIDNMDIETIQTLHKAVREKLVLQYPLLFKPANHMQEASIKNIDRKVIPRVYNHELFASSSFVPLNEGLTSGRIRHFQSLKEYEEEKETLEWYDILVMNRVPEDIPRVSGIINIQHTTPLSHTNVLAHGWQIPNSTQIGIEIQIEKDELNGKWVQYQVERKANKISLKKIAEPKDLSQRPSWSIHQVKLDAPEINFVPILPLEELRLSDSFRYGTKAANLGELYHIIKHGSDRLLGFYRINRPPRKNLLNYIADYIGGSKTDLKTLSKETGKFIANSIEVPRGIAIPFSIQQNFLASSPQIQQLIGKIKMALELGAKEVDPLCLKLQRLIRSTRISQKIKDTIDQKIVEHLGGVSSFVVRSSSNAEDLEHFSAAGIYESFNHVTTAENIFDSIKEVWASLISPRSIRLRQEVGISLDDCYMGVIIQEEITTAMGGVMVTRNQITPDDFRNIFLNVSPKSVVDVVEGSELPIQYLFNTVEGGGRTLSLGSASEDLDMEKQNTLQKLAYIGRLLQSHFSRDYTFSMPLDIEWAISNNQIYILQLRPYVG